MTLELAAVLGLAAACAPGVAPETLAAVARAESGLHPLAINVNGAGAGAGGGALRPAAATPAEAAERARALIRQGRSVDLGLMQINSRNLGWLGLAVEDAFDPCRSLAAGARVLTALSAYNTGSPTRGLANGYVARVRAAGLANAAAAAGATTAAPPPFPPARATDTASAAPSARAACAPSWDVWARCPEPPSAAAAPPPSAAPAATAARAENPAADADDDGQGSPSAAPPLRLRGRLAMGDNQ